MELQKKYANDQQRLQQEMMKVYKENNVSMTGGCLPLLIQFPILIGLYRVIQRPLTYIRGINFADSQVVENVKLVMEQMKESFPEVIGNLANVTVEQINKMLEDADVELAIKRENMQKLFGRNMSNFQGFMEDVSAVQAKVGTTYSKLELIQTRVIEQVANFEELKSSNEDIETEEAAIELYQAELVYESALSTTASVIKKTLLDYL
jgi:YidC/Oxa1 family membrane protein insertase